MTKTTKVRDERLSLIEALSALQKTHKAIIDKYSIDTKARLRELLDTLRGRSPSAEKGGGGAGVPMAKAREMLEEVKDTKLKPDKGRGKDLYRIEKLISELEDIYQGK